MEDRIVNLIVPLYYGKKYLSRIMEMYRANKMYLKKCFPEMELQLVLVNDSPDESIQIEENGVKVIINCNNEGIHASRVIGFLGTAGKYVLFLDQDDIISDLYVAKQLQRIGSFDAIVCNGVDNGVHIYDSKEQFYHKISEIGYNGIISPGQVLIKRSAIPKEWTQNILKHSGTDDYFLWILMLLNKSKFVYNEECLFEHIRHRSNKSNDITGMIESHIELKEKIESIIDEKTYMLQIAGGIDSIVELYRKQIKIQDMLERIKRDNTLFLQYLNKICCESVIVYGFGKMGRCFLQTAIEAGIDVRMIIDKNNKEDNLLERFEIKKPVQETFMHITKNQLVIVTPLRFECEIKKLLLDNQVKNVISLTDLDRIV